MSSFETSLIWSFIVGVGVAIAMIIGRILTDKVFERKGFIGLVFVGVFSGALLWFNAHTLADYLGATTSEVQLLAIIIFVILILVIVWRNRETTERTARTTTRIVKGAKSTASRARNRKRSK